MTFLSKHRDEWVLHEGNVVCSEKCLELLLEEYPELKITKAYCVLCGNENKEYVRCKKVFEADKEYGLVPCTLEFTIEMKSENEFKKERTRKNYFWRKHFKRS